MHAAGIHDGEPAPRLLQYAAVAAPLAGAFAPLLAQAAECYLAVARAPRENGAAARWRSAGLAALAQWAAPGLLAAGFHLQPTGPAGQDVCALAANFPLDGCAGTDSASWQLDGRDSDGRRGFEFRGWGSYPTEND